MSKSSTAGVFKGLAQACGSCTAGREVTTHDGFGLGCPLSWFQALKWQFSSGSYDLLEARTRASLGRGGAWLSCRALLRRWQPEDALSALLYHRGSSPGPGEVLLVSLWFGEGSHWAVTVRDAMSA